MAGATNSGGKTQGGVSLPIANPSPASPRWSGDKLRFHVMIKPGGAVCNLDCTYCFYLHKEQLLHQPKMPRMADDVLELHIKQYIEAHAGDEVVFSWQGGEPTLLGLGFFQRVVDLQRRYLKPGQRVENDLQTNGTLLDDEWAAFLKRYGFLIGLSIDGPRDLHDVYRINKGGAPTFDRVVAASRLLKKHDVPHNLLCCINRKNASRPLDVYRFLTRDMGAKRVQFIPIVEPNEFVAASSQHIDPSRFPIKDSPEAHPGNPGSVVTDWSVDPDEWGRFLCGVWDDWLRRDYGRVHVNLFETIFAAALGLGSQICTQAECCGTGMALEHTGDLYSCDHYVYPTHNLGNIREKHEGDMALSLQQRQFGTAKRDTLPQYCRQCPQLRYCWGECPKNRIIRTPDGSIGLNYLCSGWKMFYAHMGKDLPMIMKRIQGT